METKAKIMQTAERTFGQKGFSGASIREISKLCDVNIASINYHFESKEKLFLEVVKSNRKYLEQEIKDICCSNLEVEQCVLQIFRLFVKNGDKVLLTFKFLMTNLDGQDLRIIKTAEGQFGPPGIDFFLDYLISQFPDTDLQALQFMSRNVFSVICQSSLALSCPGLGKHLKKSNNYNLQSQENNLVELSKFFVSAF